MTGMVVVFTHGSILRNFADYDLSLPTASSQTIEVPSGGILMADEDALIDDTFLAAIARCIYHGELSETLALQ